VTSALRTEKTEKDVGYDFVPVVGDGLVVFADDVNA
jgi:hypothetical protein